jgi:hypothetical protein
LADPGLAGQHHNPAGPVGRHAPLLLQRSNFRGPAEELRSDREQAPGPRGGVRSAGRRRGHHTEFVTQQTRESTSGLGGPGPVTIRGQQCDQPAVGPLVQRSQLAPASSLPTGLGQSPIGFGRRDVVVKFGQPAAVQDFPLGDQPVVVYFREQLSPPRVVVNCVNPQSLRGQSDVAPGHRQQRVGVRSPSPAERPQRGSQTGSCRILRHIRPQGCGNPRPSLRSGMQCEESDESAGTLR